MTWDELLAPYLDTLGDLSPVTQEASRRWLLAFAAWCRAEGLDGPQTVSPGHLEAFRARLVWTPGPRGHLYSPNSVDQALRMVRAFLRWACAAGHLALDPSRDLVLGRPEQPPQRVLTPEEVERLLATPDAATAHGQRDRAILALLYALEVSSAECAALDLVHLHLPRRRLAVPDPLEERLLDVPDSLASLLDRYVHDGRRELAGGGFEPALFLGRDGRRLGLPRLRQLVGQLGRAAGLGPRISPRVLQRSFRAHTAAFHERRFPPSSP